MKYREWPLRAITNYCHVVLTQPQADQSWWRTQDTIYTILFPGNRHLDFALSVAGTTEQVQVTSKAPLVDTTESQGVRVDPNQRSSEPADAE